MKEESVLQVLGLCWCVHRLFDDGSIQVCGAELYLCNEVYLSDLGFQRVMF